MTFATILSVIKGVHQHGIVQNLFVDGIQLITILKNIMKRLL